MKYTNTLQLIRIKDWFKNLIIFFPIIFSGKILEYSNYINLIIGFILFSIVCSSVYILNDIIDKNKDKIHPIKKNIKPLASGLISLRYALMILFILCLILTISMYFFDQIRQSIIIYIFISLSYIFFIKNIPYFEFLFLPLVYVIRINLGSNIIEVDSSLLMLLCTYLISTFFILLKRIGELNLFTETTIYETRKVLKYYSIFGLKMITIGISIILIILLFYYSYIQNLLLLLTFPIIIYFLYRYYTITKNTTKGEFPINVILNDKLLILNIIITFLILLFIYI